MVYDTVLRIRISSSMADDINAVLTRRRVSDPHQSHSITSVAREALSAMLAGEVSPAPATRVRARPAAR